MSRLQVDSLGKVYPTAHHPWARLWRLLGWGGGEHRIGHAASLRHM